MVKMVAYEAFACPCGAGDVVLQETYKPKAVDLQHLHAILQELQHLKAILWELQHLKAILRELQNLKLQALA
ncbi:hypothetical protein Tco_1129261 [Tanacetum coccineum]